MSYYHLNRFQMVSIHTPTRHHQKKLGHSMKISFSRPSGARASTTAGCHSWGARWGPSREKKVPKKKKKKTIKYHPLLYNITWISWTFFRFNTTQRSLSFFFGIKNKHIFNYNNGFHIDLTIFNQQTCGIPMEFPSWICHQPARPPLSDLIFRQKRQDLKIGCGNP